MGKRLSIGSPGEDRHAAWTGGKLTACSIRAPTMPNSRGMASRGQGILPSLVRLQRATTQHQTQNPSPKEKPPSTQQTVAQINLGTAVRRATIAANENRRESSRVSCLPAWTGDFSYRNTSFVPFSPATPFFPALRSVPLALPGASCNKQLPAAAAHGGPHPAPANQGLRNQLLSGKSSPVSTGLIVTHR